MIEFDVTIDDGHKYRVRVDSNGKVVATQCYGRWPMTVTTTGSDWLDEQLQRAATAIVKEQKTMTPEQVDQMATALDSLPNTNLDNDPTSHWSNGRAFDLVELSRIRSKQNMPGISLNPSDSGTWRDVRFQELTVVGNVYGLTFRHNGDYCWFDKKTDANDKLK